SEMEARSRAVSGSVREIYIKQNEEPWLRPPSPYDGAGEKKPSGWGWGKETIGGEPYLAIQLRMLTVPRKETTTRDFLGSTATNPLMPVTAPLPSGKTQCQPCIQATDRRSDPRLTSRAQGWSRPRLRRRHRFLPRT